MLTHPSDLFSELSQMFPDEEFEVHVGKHHWSIKIGDDNNCVCIHDNVQFEGFEVYMLHNGEYKGAIECMGNPKSVWVDDESGWLVIESRIAVHHQYEFASSKSEGTSTVKIDVTRVLRND